MVEQPDVATVTKGTIVPSPTTNQESDNRGTVVVKAVLGVVLVSVLIVISVVVIEGGN